MALGLLLNVLAPNASRPRLSDAPEGIPLTRVQEIRAAGWPTGTSEMGNVWNAVCDPGLEKEFKENGN
jgi:hypothetical protein